MSLGSQLASNFDLADSIDPRITPVNAPKGTIYRYVPAIGNAEILQKQDNGTTTNYVSVGGGSSSGADLQLSNLVGPTAVPVSIIPANDQIINLGALGKSFADGYVVTFRDINGQASIQPSSRVLIGPNNHQPVLQWKDTAIYLQYDALNGVKDIIIQTNNIPNREYYLRAPANVNGFFQFPATLGANGQVLSTDGAGITSWITISSGGANTTLSNLSAPTSINQDLIPNTISAIKNLGQAGGSGFWTNAYIGFLRDTADTPVIDISNRRLVSAAGVEVMSWDNSGINIDPSNSNARRSVNIYGQFSGFNYYYTRIFASNALASDTLFQLPATNGLNGQVLTTDGTGVTSWVTISSGGANTTLSNLTAPTSINQDLLPVNGSINLGNFLGHYYNQVVTQVVWDSTGGISINLSTGTLDYGGEQIIKWDHSGIIPPNGSKDIGSATHSFNQVFAAVFGQNGGGPSKISFAANKGIWDKDGAQVLDWNNTDILLIGKGQSGGSRYVGFQGASNSYVYLVAPTVGFTSYSMVLPPTIGAAGQVLATDGSGFSYWLTLPSGGNVYNLMTTSSNIVVPLNDVWIQFTGNSITLTEGTWKLFGSVEMLGAGAQYSLIIGMWGGTNGANNSTQPTALSTIANLTVNSVFTTLGYSYVPLNLVADYVGSDPVIPTIVTVAAGQTATVYLNAFQHSAIPTQGLVKVYANAERIN